MKYIILFFIYVFALGSIAEEATKLQETVTIREAKAECKKLGKKGRELVQCIKEKVKK